MIIIVCFNSNYFNLEIMRARIVCSSAVAGKYLIFVSTFTAPSKYRQSYIEVGTTVQEKKFVNSKRVPMCKYNARFVMAVCLS